MKDKVFVSTNNIFEDLGLEDSEKMKARSDLMSEVVHIIKESGLSQKDISLILGISEPKVSSLMHGKINDFSSDTLMEYLAQIGCKVQIRVEVPRRLSKSVKRGHISVKKRTYMRRRTSIHRRRGVLKD